VGGSGLAAEMMIENASANMESSNAIKTTFFMVSLQADVDGWQVLM
jgi:hypothetical protein